MIIQVHEKFESLLNFNMYSLNHAKYPYQVDFLITTMY